MKSKAGPLSDARVIDPRHPWKLPRSKWEIPKYPATQSVIEWNALLARAAQSNPDAEVRVAEIYSDGSRDGRGGLLVRVSPRKAVEWYRRSAEHGNAIAQGALGYLLSEGIGARKDPSEALRWMKRAFRQLGSSGDANNIAVTYRQIGNLGQAVRWFKKAVAAGDHGDLVQLGVHYYWGKGVRTNHAVGARYFRRALQEVDPTWFEHSDALFYLGLAHLEGRGARRSFRLAQRNLERANKDNDHPAAQRLLRQLTKISSKRG